MRGLLDTQRVVLEQFQAQAFYDRQLFQTVTLDNMITGILGSRGIGKTTYLLHMVDQHNKQAAGSALYVSADMPFFTTGSLLEVADYLYKETNTKLLCIDEIHKYPNWEQEIKNMADIYKSIKVLFTGSSMIDIIHSKFDLSRRVTLHYLSGLSFREYLDVYHDYQLPVISWNELISNHMTIAEGLPVKKILKHFREYLASGYYFYFTALSTEYERFQTIENIVQKIIYEDISVLHDLKTSTLKTIEKAYKFILNSAPGELSPAKLSGLLAKSYDQTIDYLTWLEHSGLIVSLHKNKRGNAFLKAPEKLLPENTNLMYAAYLPQTQAQMTGKVREAFFVNQVKNAKQKIFYSHKGDFQVEGCLFEIGGKNKSNYQISGEANAFVVADDVLVGDARTIPLYLFGFLY